MGGKKLFDGEVEFQFRSPSREIKRSQLGNWNRPVLRFAVTSVPAYVLIDPAGKIAAQEYSLEKIEAELQKRFRVPTNDDRRE